MERLTITNDSFVKTAPIYDPNAQKSSSIEPIMNPQTVFLCEKLGIDDPLQVVMARAGRTMKQPNMTESYVCTETSPTIRTPCSKLSLPAPVTPLVNNDISQTDLPCSPNSSVLSESFDNGLESTNTPLSNKKIFKRRNLAMYTPDVDDNVNTSTSSITDSDSPRSSKLPCRANIL